MGKLNIFEITLSNPQAVYYGGQTIDGYITVELNEEMKMRGIRLHFNGGARVHWTEQHSSGSGKNRRTTTRHYSSHETYFDHCIVLFGKGPGQSGEDPVLKPGRYTYPFHYQLPVGIPSSYESYIGRVRYSLTGVIDRPWRFDHNTKRAFTVLDVLDLNREPMALRTGQGSGEKTLCCLCCASGPITCDFKLNRLGYVPGEVIPLYAEIRNSSRRKMAKTFADLHMCVQYHATCKTKYVSQVVSNRIHGPIEPGDSDSWNGDQLLIPPLPASGLRGCRIIDIKYMITMNVDPTGIGFDLSVPLEILIGTIPLQSVMQQYGFSSDAQGFTQPSTNTTSIPIEPSAPDMPPPSYAECNFGQVDIRDETDNEHTRGNMQYTPIYTYYNWNQHTDNSFNTK
ncbi:hypothetical protein LOTGIDRAFT_227836 [Lottia gigantea]|uniref:Arrestin C-terminal-like domain-containing protein n=1 Tax=Lottia gigantea TaxID=225164 RepID=V4BGW3_LOTGI|nr:hypothetical protein LOTGIDRAFT_227836 [Lottia gigantea]ESP05157.1 hypothetical protein LOTGIDRAFT_227836 [Lottia gigantea]